MNNRKFQGCVIKASNVFNRGLKNYCACRYSVKIRLKVLIYRHKLRFFAEFCLGHILALVGAHDVFQHPVIA